MITDFTMILAAQLGLPYSKTQCSEVNTVIGLKRVLSTTMIGVLLGFSCLIFPNDLAAQTKESITNQDVVELVKLGFSESVIKSKIDSSEVEFDLSTEALKDLKLNGVPDSVIILMLDSSKRNGRPERLKDELTASFSKLQNTIVTVWSEIGHGTGFIFDEAGLLMTNQHVVGPSEYIAVQFDSDTKIKATLLASDPEKDVAILWVDLDALPSAIVANLANLEGSEPEVMEGERVFTIGSPLNQRKIITTGIASRIEEKAILSDININHGNSGGPLFNSIGEVVGITTFKDVDLGGAGVSGIVRIKEAVPLIEVARAKMIETEKPSGKLLLTDPTDTFPLDAIKEVATAKKFDQKSYFAGVGGFTLLFYTPTLKYRLETEAEREAEKARKKRNKKEGAVQGTFRPFEEFRAWREYVGDYKPILIIQATPELKESFWGAVGRGIAANYGIHTQAKLRFKTDFYRMKLFCGDKEVEPIHPGKIAYLLNESNYFVNIKDATYAGAYSYPADAINESCGRVTLEVYSEKEPDKAKREVLKDRTVGRIISDFRPYLEQREP